MPNARAWRILVECSTRHCCLVGIPTAKLNTANLRQLKLNSKPVQRRIWTSEQLVSQGSSDS
jgi:hypothetical protein